VAVGHEDQKDIQQQLMVAEAGPKTIAYEAMLDKSEAPDNLADSLGTAAPAISAVPAP